MSEDARERCNDALVMEGVGLFRCSLERGHDGSHQGDYSDTTKVTWKRPRPAEVPAVGENVKEGK